MQPGRNKAFIWLFLSLVLAGLLIVIALRPAGADPWEAMTERVDKLRLETRTRKSPRSPLREKLVAGNAWDEYNIALNDALHWTDDQNGAIFLLFANGEKGVDRSKVERLVASHASALEHLQRGAQRSDGQYPYNWERGAEMELPSLLASRRLASAAVAQARIWTEKGRVQDATNLLLDVTVFGRDLATNGTLLSSLIGYAVHSVAADEIRHLIQSGAMTEKQLADLAQKLQTVERDLPGLRDAFANENLLIGTTMVEMGMPTGEWWTFLRRGEFQIAANPRASMVEAFEISEDHLKRSMKLDEMDYDAARREADAISLARETSRNAIVRTAIPSFGKSVTTQRTHLTKLRLLRAGTTFMATGKMPTIPDPFGTNLRYRQEAGKTIIWSVGSDGVDQNGKGNWEGNPDIVLEVPRSTSPILQRAR